MACSVSDLKKIDASLILLCALRVLPCGRYHLQRQHHESFFCGSDLRGSDRSCGVLCPSYATGDGRRCIFDKRHARRRPRTQSRRGELEPSIFRGNVWRRCSPFEPFGLFARNIDRGAILSGFRSETVEMPSTMALLTCDRRLSNREDRPVRRMPLRLRSHGR